MSRVIPSAPGAACSRWPAASVAILPAHAATSTRAAALDSATFQFDIAPGPLAPGAPRVPRGHRRHRGRRQRRHPRRHHDRRRLGRADRRARARPSARRHRAQRSPERGADLHPRRARAQRARRGHRPRRIPGRRLRHGHAHVRAAARRAAGHHRRDPGDDGRPVDAEPRRRRCATCPGSAPRRAKATATPPCSAATSSTSDFYVDGLRDDVQYYRDLYNVERVEALKGPNAMIFGRGGAGGVINRSTRQADWSRVREATLQAGSSDNRRATFDLGDRLGNTRRRAGHGGLRELRQLPRRRLARALRDQPDGRLRPGPRHHRPRRLRVLPRRAHRRPRRPVARRPAVLDRAPSTFFGDPSQSTARATVNAVSLGARSPLRPLGVAQEPHPLRRRTTSSTRTCTPAARSAPTARRCRSRPTTTRPTGRTCSTRPT